MMRIITIMDMNVYKGFSRGGLEEERGGRKGC
jgi:hypothetical protein